MRFETLRLVAANGVPFAVRMLRHGEPCGLGHQLTSTSGDPMVEFYDARQDDGRFAPGLGQFVSRYQASTISSGFGGGAEQRGLNLQGGVPEWSVDGAAMSLVAAWVRERTAGAGKPS